MIRKKSYVPERNVLSYRPVKRKPKNRRALFFTIVFLVFVFLSSAIYAILKADFFKVTSLDVSGNRLLSRETVIDAAASAVTRGNRLAPLLGADHIWFWSLAPRELSLLNPPELQSVSVRSDFWKRSVLLSAAERNITHIVCKTSEGACYGVAEDGVVFARIPEVRGGLILKIEDESAEPVEIGKPYFQNQSFLGRIYETRMILESKGFVPSAIRVRERALDEWEAEFSSGLMMYFSGAFVPKNLGPVLDEIRKNGDISRFQYIDFRMEDKVFYQ